MPLPDLLVPVHSPPPKSSEPGRLAVCAVTIVVATSLLAVTLRVQTGSAAFAMFGLFTAIAWTGGALLSGPIPVRLRTRSLAASAWQPAVLGVVLFGVFAVAYQAASRMPMLSGSLDSLLGRADAGPRALVLVIALVNGFGEELFFRGALHAALARCRPALSSGLLYVVVTFATGSVALVVAAVVVGSLLGLVRLATGGVLAPIIVHLTWSTLMVLVLPH